ncbi:MAG: DUF4364 family protein, partial [Oscillospiraceae bacterium]
MENEIVAGIGVGGLKDKYEIKILICYLLNSIEIPLSKEQLNYIFQGESFVNYFSFCDALNELLQNGHISQKVNDKNSNEEIYYLNELGVETAQKLKNSLPKSLKDNVITAAMQLIAKNKSGKENEVSIEPYKNGFMVHCIFHDIDFDLMRLDVFAPD